MSSDEVRRLKREIGFLGAFSMGFADVGADVFLAIGIVALYAGGFAPLSFLVASICYITTGLVYAELTSLYPYAGGGQVFGMRAGGNALGFLVGWAILLDYVLDIGLFSIASAGYLSYLFPLLNSRVDLTLGFVDVSLTYLGVVAFVLVLFLIGINLIGIRESSKFNEVLVVVTLLTELLVLSFAFLFAFSPDFFLSQLGSFGNPLSQPHVYYTKLWDVKTENFIYGITLAMSSFIGIESIAQAAEETRNPWKYLPRSFKYSIVAVLTFTLLFSVVGLGVLGWRGLADNIYNPIAQITSKIPLIGPILALGVAFIAFAITLVSTNTGVIGVSRVTYSMSKFNLIPKTFSKLHKKRAVPYYSIVFFGLVGGLLALTGNLEMVAGLYNFGALLSYMFVNYSHIKLRKVDFDAYRPWRTPLNFHWKNYEISLLAVLGLISTTALFGLVVLYHPMGRILGGLWIFFGVFLYLIYTKVFRKLVKEEEVPVTELKPVIYKIKTVVFVPMYADKNLIFKSIYYNLEDIYDLHLVTLIEVPKRLKKPFYVSWKEILSLKRDAESVLSDACSRLEENGFSCKKTVLVGPKDSLISHINNLNPDTIVILTNKKPRGKGERIPLVDDLKSDYRIISLIYYPKTG